MKHHFCLRLWLTNFSCTYLSIFWMFYTKKAYQLKENWNYLLPMIKFKLSKKLKFRKICISYHDLQGFPILKDITNETLGYVNECDFLYHIMKGANIWKTCIVEWTSIFRITHRWWYKMGKRPIQSSKHTNEL